MTSPTAEAVILAPANAISDSTRASISGHGSPAHAPEVPMLTNGRAEQAYFSGSLAG